MPDDTTPGGRRVALAGATGLVGRELLRQLLDDASVAEVHALGRRAPNLQHPRLVVHVVDFSALPPLPRVGEVYLALGTTIKVAGSEAAFRAVDHDATLAVARAGLAAGARRVGLVSAMGADARSRLFYNRVKGETEQAIAALAYDTIVVARPSLLRGDRDALGQPSRAGERLGLAIAALLGPLLPFNVRPIHAADVARALLARVPTTAGRVILLSGAMQPA